MKKTNLTISFESEKLDALTYCIGKKDIDLQDELADTIQKMYEKHVPQPTREYIEDKLSRESTSKKPQKTVAPKTTGGSSQGV